MTSYSNHPNQRGGFTSNKSFYNNKRNSTENKNTNNSSIRAPPRMQHQRHYHNNNNTRYQQSQHYHYYQQHQNQSRSRYYQPCSNTADIDDLIYGPAITMAMSERNIFFTAFDNTTMVHIPPKSKKSSLHSQHNRRRRSTTSFISSITMFYANLYDPLETTTKEPLQPNDDPISGANNNNNNNDDESNSSSSSSSISRSTTSSSSLSTTKTNHTHTHQTTTSLQRPSNTIKNTKPVTHIDHRLDYYHHNELAFQQQQQQQQHHPYPCYYPLPPPPPQYAYYHQQYTNNYQVAAPMMTSSPTASSSSSTSMTEFMSSTATTATTTTTNGTMPATVNTNTDHPYANNTVGRTDPEELLAEDLHRRASTISDAVTTTSSAEICRRFSNGSTSSTAASSMVTLPSVEEKPSPDSVVVSAVNPLVTTPPAPPQSEEEENKQTVSSSASSTQSPDFTNDIVDQLAISPVPISSSSPDEQGQEEPSLIKKEDEQVQVSSFTPIKEEEEEEEKEVEKELEQHNENNNDAELPVWADPDRVRENPTRYQYVKEYMDKHDIPKTSVMELPNAYTFYFSETAAAKHQKTPTANYMSTVKPIFDCQTVWNFSSRWRYYKQNRNGRPSQMKNNQNLYCFIKDVAPMWEDSTNKNGGRFTLCPNKTDMDELFDLILASFIGGTLSEFGMVGVVLSKRNRGDRIELWLDGSASIDTIPPLQAKLCQYLSEPLCALVNASRYKKHFDK